MRSSLIFALTALAALATQTARADLTSEVERIIATSGMSGAIFGIRVENEAGTVLYERASRTLLVPASVRKLFTAVAAVECHGLDARIPTRFLISGDLMDGALYGDLVIRGGGDPTLGSRFWEWRDLNFEPLLRVLREEGITRIEGRVVADVSRFDEEVYPIGWKHSNLGESYAPPIDALAFNENVVGVFVQKRSCLQTNAWSDPAFVPVADASGCERGNLKVVVEDENRAVVRGESARTNGVQTHLPAISDAGLYAAQAVDEYLVRNGIVVTTPPTVTREPSGDTFLTRLESPPLYTILGTMLEWSSNLFAEMLLKGLQEGTHVTWEQSLDLEKATLAGLGLDPSGFHFTDGSGLSVEDWATPETVVRLVRHITDPSRRAVWQELLPEPGEGTLRRRLDPLRERLWAKTGSLNGVRALAGTLIADDGSNRYFVIILNQAVPSSNATNTVDAIALAISRN